MHIMQSFHELYLHGEPKPILLVMNTSLPEEMHAKLRSRYADEIRFVTWRGAEDDAELRVAVEKLLDCIALPAD